MHIAAALEWLCGKDEQLQLYLQLCKRSVKVEDSVALLDELALLLARRQNHGLHITCEVSCLACGLDLEVRWLCLGLQSETGGDSARGA